MSNSNVTVSMNWMALLGIAFVVLKLCNIINWSWWWVTLPFWGGLVVVAILLIGIFGLFVIKEFLSIKK